MNYFVVKKRSGNKEKQINFRVSVDIKRDLEATAQFRGLSVSSWLHFIIVQANNEAKLENMARFREIFELQKLEREQTGEKVPANSETNNAIVSGSFSFFDKLGNRAPDFQLAALGLHLVCLLPHCQN